jgi:hypothetical protein
VEGEGVGFDKSEGNPYWGWIAEYGGDWYQGAVKTGIGTSIPLLSRARMNVDVDGGSRSTRGDGCEESDLCEQVGGFGQDLCPGDGAGGGLLGRSSRCGRRVSVDDTDVCRWNQVHRIGCPVHSCHPRVSRSVVRVPTILLSLTSASPTCRQMREGLAIPVLTNARHVTFLLRPQGIEVQAGGRRRRRRERRSVRYLPGGRRKLRLRPRERGECALSLRFCRILIADCLPLSPPSTFVRPTPLPRRPYTHAQFRPVSHRSTPELPRRPVQTSTNGPPRRLRTRMSHTRRSRPLQTRQGSGRSHEQVAP